MATPIYIPINRVGGFLFLHIRSRQKTVWVAGEAGLLLRLGCEDAEDEGEMGLVAGYMGRDSERQ